MKHVKFFTLVAVLVFTIESKEFFRYKAVKCGASLKSAANLYCYVKSYSRKHSFANLGFVLLRHVPNGKVRKKQDQILKTADNFYFSSISRLNTSLKQTTIN